MFRHLQALLADPVYVAAPDALELAPFATAASIEDETAFMAELRQVRRRELARIAWRDLAGLAATAETLTALSRLADAAIIAADGSVIMPSRIPSDVMDFCNDFIPHD